MRKKTVLIVVPTYNESGNIGRLLNAIFSLKVQDKGWSLDVLVMDDNSPDGTGEIVRKLAETKYKDRLFLESGQKQGLGRALQRSFDAALRRKHEVILTMDADFSHDPKDIPRLLKTIDEGYDVVYASRYVPGAFIPGDWPMMLIVRTRIASFVARWLGGVSKDLKEITGNFRAIRRHVLEQIDYNSAQANGYGMQIFLSNAFTNKDFRVTEIPITFHSRAEGAPKGRVKDVIEFFKIAYRLNPDSPGKQVMRFLMVGASGTIINLSCLWMLRNAGLNNLVLASFLAIQISVMWNFMLHNVFTFKAYRHAVGSWRLPIMARNFALFEGATLLTQTITLSVSVLLTFSGLHFILAQLTGIGTAFVVNYYISSRYIWSLAKTYAV